VSKKKHEQPIEPQLRNASDHPPPPEEARASVDETPMLRAEVERARADESGKMVEEAAKNLAAASRRADEAESQRKALHSDLMVLEQTAAGRAPDIALQTDLGKSAAHALSEVLTILDKMNERGLEGDPLPAKGWSSPRARELVEAVQAQPGLRASDVRALLLGDLLVQLAPHVGETGQNETATDTLRRIIEEGRRNAAREESLVAECQQERERANTLEEKHAKLQAALTARRSAINEAHAQAREVAETLQREGLPVVASTDEAMGQFHRIVQEWKGLRGFLSAAPLVAVAVRDDSTKEVRERYTVLLLEWDGKQVAVSTFDAGMPWQDVAPRMRGLVETRLVPEPHRS
jgi:hypothetical protein